MDTHDSEDDLSKLNSTNKLFGSFVKNSIELEGSSENPLTLSGTYSKDSFKRLRAHYVIVSGTFSGCGFAQSKFVDVKFDNAILYRCNMQFSEFNNCMFVDRSDDYVQGESRYNTLHLDQSVFVDCVFEGIAFDFCTFSEARFLNCTFRSCRTWGTALESAVFDGCSFEGVEFCWGNFEYSRFVECAYHSLRISISQAPYVFGFDGQLNSDKVCYSNDSQVTSPIAYREHAAQLAQQYLVKGEYFPAVNIYHAIGNQDAVANLLNEGIEHYSFQRNYRAIVHLARLASTFDTLSRNQLLGLLAKVAPPALGNLTKSEARLAEQSFVTHFPAIQKYLLSMPGNNAKLRLAIQSEAYSQEERMELLDKVENSLRFEKPVFHSIEVQHNSDIFIIVDLSFVIDNAPVIIDFVQNQVASALHDIGLGVAGNVIWDVAKVGLMSVMTFRPLSHHGRRGSVREEIKEQTPCTETHPSHKSHT